MHAYLIIAHDRFEQLRTLLRLIDDARNDIFIHIDRKAGKIDQERIRSAVHRSRIVFVERISVQWGGYSQIECELRLLEAAVETGAAQGGYEYLHLLSGVDLPLKSQDEIHDFFDRHRGTEFVDCSPAGPGHSDRVRRYHLFIESTGRRKGLLHLIEKWSVALQRVLKIYRNEGLTLYKGTNWFSITHALAEYVVSQKSSVEKTFRHTRCADEMFLQTLVGNSHLGDRLFVPDKTGNGSERVMRLIDWTRGKPYTFRKEDFAELTSSEELFARKFDEKTDPEIVAMIARYVENR